MYARQHRDWRLIDSGPLGGIPDLIDRHPVTCRPQNAKFSFHKLIRKTEPAILLAARQNERGQLFHLDELLAATLIALRKAMSLIT